MVERIGKYINRLLGRKPKLSAEQQLSDRILGAHRGGGSLEFKVAGAESIRGGVVYKVTPTIVDKRVTEIKFEGNWANGQGTHPQSKGTAVKFEQIAKINADIHREQKHELPNNLHPVVVRLYLQRVADMLREREPQKKAAKKR